MGSCMVEKLKNYLDLNERDTELLLNLEETEESYSYGEKIRAQGEEDGNLFVIKKGWAFTSYTVDNDVRSIFNLELSGDIVGISELSFDHYLFDLNALTDVTVCPFPRKNLNIMFEKSPRLARAFYSVLSREQSMLYERIVSLGRRTALEKVSHLILEIFIRLNNLGKIDDGLMDFPVRQEHIADLLGLSSIHVNRSMNELKRHGYIEYNRSSLKILDQQRLMSLSNLNPKFLEKPKVDWHFSEEKAA